MEETNSIAASSSAAPPDPPSWIDLPQKVTANILQRVGAQELLESTQKVCMTWRRVCKEPSMWRKIHLFRYSTILEAENMCRHAVDLSQGQLVEITLGNFGSDDLLQYIAERSSQLQCLRVLHGSITGKGLVEATKMLPLLETLYITCFYNVGEFIQQLGRCIPKLKSFTIYSNVITLGRQPEEDTDAMSIAETMPELRHLSLSGNRMTNKGLAAILDACPHLESLELRYCLNLDLSGDLGERCSQQMKSLKIVNDTEDSESEDTYDDDSSDDCGYGYESEDGDELAEAFLENFCYRLRMSRLAHFSALTEE